MADVVLLTVVGLHEPVILLFEIVGSTGTVPTEQIGAISSNVGIIVGVIEMIVEHDTVPQLLLAVQVMMDSPTLKLPLALLPIPLLAVAPVIT